MKGGTFAILWTVFIAVVGSIVYSSEVMENRILYSCCENSLLFDQSCENTWSHNGKNLAHFTSEINNCVPPCKKLKSGMISLDPCVDVNLTMVCRRASNVVEEKHIFYQNQPCYRTDHNGAPRHLSSVGLALLAAVIGGWFVKQMV